MALVIIGGELLQLLVSKIRTYAKQAFSQSKTRTYAKQAFLIISYNVRFSQTSKLSYKSIPIELTTTCGFP